MTRTYTTDSPSYAVSAPPINGLIRWQELRAQGLEKTSFFVSWLSDYSCLFIVNTPTTNTILRGQVCDNI